MESEPSLHEEPQIPNYVDRRNENPRLKEGMVLAIEPMVNAGGPEMRVLSDKWTAVTKDGSVSARFEHCVAVTENGPWVLTRPAKAAKAIVVDAVVVGGIDAERSGSLEAGESGLGSRACSLGDENEFYASAVGRSGAGGIIAPRSGPWKNCSVAEVNL